MVDQSLEAIAELICGDNAATAPLYRSSSMFTRFFASAGLSRTLSEMIDVARAVGWIDLDVKRFSHALREFRNLIHPYQQLATRANPDADTCGISWLVVQAAANDLARILVGKK
jgi:hypothetical protein